LGIVVVLKAKNSKVIGRIVGRVIVDMMYLDCLSLFTANATSVIMSK
jgi:hypothetical protein